MGFKAASYLIELGVILYISRQNSRSFDDPPASPSLFSGVTSTASSEASVDVMPLVEHHSAAQRHFAKSEVLSGDVLSLGRRLNDPGLGFGQSLASVLPHQSSPGFGANFNSHTLHLDGEQHSPPQERLVPLVVSAYMVRSQGPTLVENHFPSSAFHPSPSSRGFRNALPPNFGVASPNASPLRHTTRPRNLMRLRDAAAATDENGNELGGAPSSSTSHRFEGARALEVKADFEPKEDDDYDDFDDIDEGIGHSPTFGTPSPPPLLPDNPYLFHHPPDNNNFLQARATLVVPGVLTSQAYHQQENNNTQDPGVVVRGLGATTSQNYPVPSPTEVDNFVGVGSSTNCPGGSAQSDVGAVGGGFNLADAIDFDDDILNDDFSPYNGPVQGRPNSDPVSGQSPFSSLQSTRSEDLFEFAQSLGPSGPVGGVAPEEKEGFDEIQAPLFADSLLSDLNPQDSSEFPEKRQIGDPSYPDGDSGACSSLGATERALLEACQEAERVNGASHGILEGGVVERQFSDVDLDVGMSAASLEQLMIDEGFSDHPFPSISPSLLDTSVNPAESKRSRFTGKVLREDVALYDGMKTEAEKLNIWVDQDETGASAASYGAGKGFAGDFSCTSNYESVGGAKPSSALLVQMPHARGSMQMQKEQVPAVGAEEEVVIQPPGEQDNHAGHEWYEEEEEEASDGSGAVPMWASEVTRRADIAKDRMIHLEREHSYSFADQFLRNLPTSSPSSQPPQNADQPRSQSPSDPPPGHLKRARLHLKPIDHARAIIQPNAPQQRTDKRSRLDAASPFLLNSLEDQERLLRERRRQDEEKRRELRRFREEAGLKAGTPKLQDQKVAEAHGLPFSLNQLIDSTYDDFNAMIQMRGEHLTETQKRVCRDIRRRGRNKVAARNCRQRRIETSVSLSDTVSRLEEKQKELEKINGQLREERELLERMLYRGDDLDYRAPGLPASIPSPTEASSSASSSPSTDGATLPQQLLSDDTTSPNSNSNSLPSNHYNFNSIVEYDGDCDDFYSTDHHSGLPTHSQEPIGSSSRGEGTLGERREPIGAQVPVSDSRGNSAAAYWLPTVSGDVYRLKRDREALSSAW